MTEKPIWQLDRVPQSLRVRAQWLVWRFERGERDKKPRKVPYYASGSRRKGDQGSEADRAALVTLDVAERVMRERGYSGVGIAFMPGDGLVGIDLDSVIDLETGVVQERALSIVAACASFTELSPSGRGLHIYVEWPHTTKEEGDAISGRSNDIGLEMYCGRQFFTVSGKHWAGTPEEVRPVDEKVLRRLMATIEQAKAARRGSQHAAAPRQPIRGDGDSQQDERALIDSALASISADLAYNDWIGVGMAIYDTLGDGALGVWDYWSAKGANYPGAHVLAQHWRSFGGRPAGNAGVIFTLAKAAGWRRPRAQRAPQLATNGSQAQAASAGGVADAPPEDAFLDSLHDSAEWMEDLRRDKAGKITGTLHNTLLVLERDTQWRGVIGFDAFAHRLVKIKDPPTAGGSEGEWGDVDDIQTLVYLSRTYGFEPKKATVTDAVLAVAYQNKFNPVAEYLEGLMWDGTPRLQKMLSSYWGAGSTADAASLDDGERLRLGVYLRLVAVKWMVGAVARVMQPGCKLDTMVCFEGDQGVKKSSALRCLFGGQWFADSKLTLGDKDALAQMHGKWCYEMAEMDAFSKADDTTFKQFLTSQVDRVRWHYGKHAQDVPRSSIFAGTTNAKEYGKDATGMRRIWPVQCGRLELEAIAADRDQLWAEAVVLYKQGVRWWVDRDRIVLDPDANDKLGTVLKRAWSEWDLFEEQADSRQQVDAYQDLISAWLRERSLMLVVTTAELLGEALKLDTSRWTRPEQMRVGAIMRRLGWKHVKAGPRNARVNGWGRPDKSIADEEADDVPL